MDSLPFGTFGLDWTIFTALFSIVIIDLILAGDNAVVIAMAVRSLPHDQRKKGIIVGAGAAVILRVILTFFVAQLLNVNYVKLVGGILILWIAVRLFIEGVPEEDQERPAATLWQAIKIIVIADITMSLDNMLAVGGASHGNLFLLLFGLGLSIPFIVFTSNLLAMLMDKYPFIIYIGAAILGKVGGEMIITDPFTTRLLSDSLLSVDRLHPHPILQYSVEAILAVSVIAAGKFWMSQLARREVTGLIAVIPSPERPGSPKPILTISSEFGSGGREIGQEVARMLGYEYVDKNSIFAEIRNDGLKWEQWAKDLDEHVPSVWEEFDWSFRGFTALIQWHIFEHASRGGTVIMGRGGNIVLRGVPHAYRVRVTAPLDVRIERIMKRESVDRDTAHWLCNKMDRGRAGFLHTIYGGRWDDPAEYDEVIAVRGQSIDAEVQSVIKALSQLVETDEARKMLRLRTAAARVKAGIATNPHFFLPLFEVLPDGEGLVLRGTTHTPKEHKQIEDEARRLAGDLPVRCEMHYRK